MPGDEREVYYVSDCSNEGRCTFFKRPVGDRIRIRLLVRAVRQNLVDF